MATVLNFQNLPIFGDADYEYSVTLSGVAFRLRLYYIEREKRWAMDLSYGDRTPIVLGEALVPDYPIFLDYYIEDLAGFLWLEPISRRDGRPYGEMLQLGDYYRLIYYYETEVEDGPTTEGQNLFANCWNRGGCN